MASSSSACRDLSAERVGRDRRVLRVADLSGADAARGRSRDIRFRTSRTCRCRSRSRFATRTRAAMHFARVKVPKPSAALGAGERPAVHFVPLEQVIGANLGALFRGNGDRGVVHVPDHALLRSRDPGRRAGRSARDDRGAGVQAALRRGDSRRGAGRRCRRTCARCCSTSCARTTFPRAGRLAERDIQDAGRLLDLERSDGSRHRSTCRRSRIRRSRRPCRPSCAMTSEHLRHHSRRRPARASSVRFVHGVRRAVPRGGGVRRSGARDQADALPHVGRYGARRRARRGGAARQAGGGDRRAQGALRRSEQHRLGAAARRRRRARRVRVGDAQDAREDGARRAPREPMAFAATSTSAAATTTRRRRASTPTSVCSRAVRRSAPT